MIAQTRPGPNASTGVLMSLGFEHVADQQDPEVGTVWEWRWTRLLGDERARTISSMTPCAGSPS